MNKLLKKLSVAEQEKLHKTSQPKWISPMLASLTHKYFSDDEWIFERKLDGERCLVFRDGNSLRLMSRNKKELDKKYPELVEALEKQKEKHFILDGEIVTFEGDVTSFARLQNRMHLTDPQEIKNSKVPVFYYLFDILYFDGYNLTKLELRSRKSILKSAISFKDPLRFMTHRIHDGEAFHKEACNKGWEGLIAKDAGSAYVHGRSKKWLKFKCVSQQEFVIGGYTEPKGERIGFGALLIGYYENKSLKYAGKVGTGYNDKLLKTLTKKLENRERKTSPFSSDDIREKKVHWVTPELVGEIGFTEWTSEGKLRHPRFLGLRDDKNPKRVVKEQ